MSIAVNPISSSAAVPPVSNNGNLTAIATYEQILALQNQNQFLTNTTQTTSSANDNLLLTADLLDLSPAALNLLNGINDSSITLGILGAASTTGTLTPTQQQAVVSIIGEFAGQPFTLETFNQIQNALTAAGVNPSQLSIQQLLGAYAYAYVPGFSFNEQTSTDTQAA